MTATQWLARQGSKGAAQLLKAARVVARDTGNPVGWIGGELIISGAISAVMKAEGATTREALDEGLLWFLPKKVLAAEATEYKKQAEALGLPFKDIEKFMKLEENDRAMYEVGAKTSEWEEQAEIGGTSRYRADPIEDQKRQRLENLRQEYIREYGEEYGTKLAQQQADAMGISLKGTYTQPYLTKARQRLYEINQESTDIVSGLKAEHGENWANPYFNLQDVKEKAAYEKAKRKQEYGEIRARPSEQIIEGGIDYPVKHKPFPEFKPVEYVPDKGFDYKYYMPDEFGMAGGGRIGLKKGKMPKIPMTRRGFLQWLLGAAGATVAAGTGLIKWGKVTGTGKTVIKAGDHIIQGTEGMPSWFIPLVNRITKEGTDVTKKLSTIEREIVHTKKISKGEEVTVYQDMNTGNVRIEYGPTHPRASNDLSTVHLEYKAPVEDVTSKGKPIKTKSEFEAVESEPQYVATGPDDAEVVWDLDNVVGNVDDLTTDTSKLKKFATKKKLTHREKVKAKKKLESRQKLESDTSTQVDYSVKKYGEGPEPDYDDYLPDIDDLD